MPNKNETGPINTENGQELLGLAEKYLDEDGLADVQVHIADGDMEIAKMYLLGAVDHLWKDKEISDEEAKEAYDILGISSEEAARIRQDSGKWSE